MPRHGDTDRAVVADLQPWDNSARRRSKENSDPSTSLWLGDVEVRPGEILIGDDDGIVVLSDSELDAALDAAEAIQQREAAIRAAILDGGSLFEQLNFTEHVDNLGAGRPSSLAFRMHER